ncbi:hypothetical protein [Nonomuraea insulae]|uniref:Transposase n=1 Tax=Nonomuraea insulae TaxID=1616787 RepID=A0ABW1CEZ6_9ACTN
MFVVGIAQLKSPAHSASLAIDQFEHCPVTESAMSGRLTQRGFAVQARQPQGSGATATFPCLSVRLGYSVRMTPHPVRKKVRASHQHRGDGRPPLVTGRAAISSRLPVHTMRVATAARSLRKRLMWWALGHQE